VAADLPNSSKSQLAISYGYSIQESFPDTWVFWIDAERTTKLEQGYREIAHAVRIKGRNDKNADILSLVYEWLRNKSNGNWVMILDNADDKEVFTSCPSAQCQASSGKQVRDFLPQSSNGSILVTSRSRDAAFVVTCKYKNIIAVEPMTESEAMLLLRSHLEETHPESEMQQLAKRLGSVPLAISQAAANISRRSLPISKYLEELSSGNEKSVSSLDESSPQLRRDSGRSNSIVATWKVTFEYVRRTTPSAARLLSLMCFFDRQDIPQALLEGQYGEEVNFISHRYRKTWWKRKLRMDGKKAEVPPNKLLPQDFEEDLLTLRDFSMIKLNRDRNKFSMHPMVQFTTMKWLVLHKQLDAWSQHFISIMNTNFPDPENRFFRSACEPLLAHAIAALPYRPNDKTTRPLQTWAELTFKVACYYNFPTGVLVSAEKLFCIAAGAFEVALGATSPQSIQCNIQRGEALWTTGHHADAEKIYRHVLRLRQESLGPNHRDTLESMDHVGNVLRYQNRYEEAEEIYLRALDIRLRTLGPAHIDTQNALVIRAVHLSGKDRYAEAYQVHRQAYEARIRGNPDSFDEIWVHSLNAMGLGLVVKGRPKEAEQLYREAIKEYEKVAPDKDMMDTLVRLARALASRDDFMGAETFFKRAMVWYNTNCACQNPDKMQTMSDYAYCLWQINRLDEAEDIATKCLAARVDNCGMQDRDTFIIMWILANILEKQGREGEALSLFRKAFEATRDVLGEQHEDTKAFQRDYINLLEKSENKALEHLDTSETGVATSVVKPDGIVQPNDNKTVGSDDCEDSVTGAEQEEETLLTNGNLRRNNASRIANARLASYGSEHFIQNDEKKGSAFSLNSNMTVEQARLPPLQQC
jgi:tetratricopeptide (TPR) repeat protein